MRRIFSVALGILAAIGGFLDIGDMVFNIAGRSLFRYQLLWVVVIGVGGIMTFAEMCGRVAAVSRAGGVRRVRERLGFGVGLVALVAAQFVNLMTLTAEIGGVALVLQLLFGAAVPGVARARGRRALLVLWLMPFGWIERVFGYRGPGAPRLRGRCDQAASRLGPGRARVRAQRGQRRPRRSTSISSSG